MCVEYELNTRDQLHRFLYLIMWHHNGTTMETIITTVTPSSITPFETNVNDISFVAVLFSLQSVAINYSNVILLKIVVYVLWNNAKNLQRIVLRLSDVLQGQFPSVLWHVVKKYSVFVGVLLSLLPLRATSWAVNSNRYVPIPRE